MDVIRTNSQNIEFIDLIKQLDEELTNKYGHQQKFYDQFNKTEACDTVIIIKHNGIAVGCGCFKSFDENTAEIKRMFVQKKSRGMDISKEILNALETWAKERGFTNSILETGIKQLEAIGLYKKSGYQITDNFGQYIGVKTSVCFKKQLS